MNRRQRRLVNIRFWADQAIEAMRVQVARLEGGSESHRVDLDFYLIAAWRLMEQIRQAWVGYQVPGAEDLWREFNTRFPYIDETRDWWIHATDRIVNHSYFADDIMRWTQPPTFVSLFGGWNESIHSVRVVGERCSRQPGFVDEAEFRRRIEVYLEVDLPDIR